MQAEEIEECLKNESISNDLKEEVSNCTMSLIPEDNDNHYMFELIEK